ncbi:CHASE2 domain-containing protein [Dolichospermum sp. UHCC 0259]|uniref:CHASE2 domain-containing protein n=1 Tax=Dolichospermum sp. UHCC 0259 TaxID=2590010 RepID=UPI0020C392A8
MLTYLGTDFQTAIHRGIEEADNLVFLMSESSLASKYCQQELTYALSLNKRIIPLLIKSVNLDQIPQELRNIQFIDFTDEEEEGKESADTDNLINILYQDAAYHYQHKLILTKALKWERQKRNSSILLRNNDLRNAEAWLKVAKLKAQQLSLPIQEEFITESLKQPPNAALDVFVSYSNADADFARKLNDTLQIQNKTTWFDQESIISGSEFAEELYKGIELSNNFLFIISPNSISSNYCATEVEYAVKMNKRIVTLLYLPVDINSLHPALAKVQWIDFRKHDGDFLTNFGELTRTLDADPNYVKNHTRLLIKAKEWEQQKRDDSFLLRGKDLAASEEWLKESENKQPSPTNLQLEYLTASRALPYRKIKLRSLLLTSLGTTIFVFIARLLGLMQPLELAAYDQVIRLRPSEPPDERFLMVDVDPQSIDTMNENPKYQQGRGSIADAALDDLLKNLSQHQPSVISLDFIRNFPAEGSLGKRLRETTNFIALCKNSYINERGHTIPGFKHAPEVPLTRVGFSDLVEEDPQGDRFIRRHYMMQKAEPKYCNVQEALSLVIARRYLEAQGHQYISPVNPETKKYDQNMVFRNTVIPRLFGNGSGYSAYSVFNKAQLNGYQTMLKYRVYQGDADRFAPRVNILDVLNNKVPAEKIKNRIILIGFTDRQSRQADYFNTPYGDVPGVTLHGQMISQILSAVLDNRPLIWWWTWDYEIPWIFGWSLVGGIVCWRLNRTSHVIIGMIGSVVVLYIACVVIMVSQSGWVPLIPPALSLIITGRGVIYLTHRLRNL